MSLQKVINYDDAGNFAFDSALIEIVGGLARLKDLRPAGATFYASYASDIDDNWGEGTLTGTATGGAAVSGGKLDLTGGTVQYVTYDADENADSQQTGAVRLVVEPGYSGTPAATRIFFAIAKAAGDSDNMINLYHLSGTGELKSTFVDSAGASTVVTWGVWSPTAGQSYELELNFDLTGGAQRLFIDGVQLGSAGTVTHVRDALIALWRVGSNVSGANSADFEIDSILYFSAVQHTAGYTPGAVISETIYDITNPTLLESGGQLMDGLEGFAEVATKPSSDEIKYTIVVDGVDYYAIGELWLVSDGTYAQSLTAAEVEAKKATLDLSAGVSMKVKAFLHSDAGSSRPELTSVTVDYNFYAGVLAKATPCIVYGLYCDSEGGPVSGATVTATNTAQYETGDGVVPKSLVVTTTTNASGYWEMAILPADYKFFVGDFKSTRTVPALATAKFVDLVEVT